MTYLLTFVIVGLCFAGLALGVILLKKPFRKRCSLDPSQHCDCDSQTEFNCVKKEEILSSKDDVPGKK